MDLLDLTGMRFGRLLVVQRAGTGRRGKSTAPTWECRCDCGETSIVLGPNLRRGWTTSCGCKTRRHGMFGTAEYAAWNAMLDRCTNPKNRNYPNYGGRGIAVCSAWAEDFAVFFRDMGPRPAPDMSLDRVNNDGNYEPQNCRWATRVMQARNKRVSRVLVVGGVSATVAEWAERTGIGRSTLKERLRRGWSPEQSVTTPTSSRTAARADL
jgi:hypothetical protein